MFSDEIGQLFLRINVNALGIEISCEFWRIEPSLCRRNLGCCKGDDFMAGIVLEIDVEVVKIPTSGSHDDNFFNHD